MRRGFFGMEAWCGHLRIVTMDEDDKDDDESRRHNTSRILSLLRKFRESYSPILCKFEGFKRCWFV
jgi:hypothetical protein